LKKFQQILVDLRKKSMQRYLDEATEMKQRLEEFFHVVEETPPKLEGSRILLLMAGTPRCLFAAMYALRLAQLLKSDLYVLHKGILAPLVLEQATDLQVNILLASKVDTLQLDEIEQIVEDNAIDFIVASGRIDFANRLLNRLSIPILFTKHPVYSQR